MFNAVLDKQAHGHGAVAAILVGEGLFVGAAFREGQITPHIGVAGINGVRDEVIVRVGDGQV